MKHYKPETLAIRTQVETTSHKEHLAPLFLTSSFIFDDAEAIRGPDLATKQEVIYTVVFLIRILKNLLINYVFLSKQRME